MRPLLDTHALLWHLCGGQKLAASANAARPLLWSEAPTGDEEITTAKGGNPVVYEEQ